MPKNLREANDLQMNMPIDEQKIIEYYDSTEIDYKLLWDLNQSMAVHLGYWDQKTRNLPQALQRENEILAEMAKIQKSDRVLDAGCGVGGSAIFLAKKFGCRVVGITLSQKQVESAIRNAKRHGVENLTAFHRMDFTRTSFGDEEFDLVWAIESVCHADDKKEFIREAFRILKRGGRLIVADGFAAKNYYNEPGAAQMQKWLNGWAVNFLETIRNFEGYLSEVGFKNISFSDVTKNVMPSSRKLYLYSFPGLVFGKIAELLKIRTKTQMANIVTAYNQYKALKTDLWKYGIFYAEKT